MNTMASPEFGERVVHKIWTQGEYRRQLKKVHQKLYIAHQDMRDALTNIGISYPEHTNQGIFVWVDSGKLALEAYKVGWLVSPGQLFNPSAQPSTYLRLNVATTSHNFLNWLDMYLNQVNNY